MKPYAIKKRAAGLLLLTVVAIMAAGCASAGSSAQAPYYGYGYNGPYDPYYGGDVIVGVPPPTDVRPPVDRPSAPPQVSQLPARPLPAPAPRPMPSSRPSPSRRR